MANELVGQGDYKFEYYPDWAVLPNNEALGTVSAVAAHSSTAVPVRAAPHSTRPRHASQGGDGHPLA